MNQIAGTPSEMGIFDELGGVQDQLSRDILSAAEAINAHRVFGMVNDVASVRIFMTFHVWCVWDFMSLAKAIQVKIGSFSLPWLPPIDAAMSRSFTELVMSEESDEGPSGKIQSHFEIYMEAMRESGADTSPIRSALLSIAKGASVDEAMSSVGAPLAAQVFVTSTFEFANSPLHVAVGAFCLGREELLPGITSKLLANLPIQDTELSIFRWYLKRHIELDSTSHGPITTNLLRYSTMAEESLRVQALTAGLRAIIARHDYLTAIANAIEATRQGDNTH